ncbi:uncharacterized protein LOC113146771 [Cyclospora cayetanensis]|uniref:Uncharacterized protein LOC113146771 n=1 Tax=Cyclospora cayetanensis TaxID=88456 RepID=A0A6P6RTL0_9EIME|nr:uncharacterized protein LOC113146771 [Cyclospora cayetanensis]
MTPNTAPQAAHGPTTTITGSFVCRLHKSPKKLSNETTAKRARSTRTASSAGRKLLTAEDPEVLRPHCEKCGCGEALRPGLDCRCHCPQCSSGKPRCSSPRMALRRKEEETCETFVTKLAMTRSRTSAWKLRNHPGAQYHEMPKISLFACAAFSNCSLRGQRESVNEASLGASVTDEAKAKRNSDVREFKKRSASFSANETRHCDPTSRPKWTVKEGLFTQVLKKPDSGSLESRSSGSKTRVSTNTYTSGREESGVFAKTNSTSNTAPGNHCEEAGGPGKKVPSHHPPCKSWRSKALKPYLLLRSVSSNNKVMKYKRPHCSMCSQLGCLRNIEVVCYCNACQEASGAECTSPRMADFKKSHAENQIRGALNLTCQARQNARMLYCASTGHMRLRACSYDFQGLECLSNLTTIRWDFTLNHIEEEAARYAVRALCRQNAGAVEVARYTVVTCKAEAIAFDKSTVAGDASTAGVL